MFFSFFFFFFSFFRALFDVLSWKIAKKCKICGENLLNFSDRSGAKECKSCRAQKMLQNAPFLAIVAVDTDENEPSKVRQLDNWVRLIIGLSAAEPAWETDRRSCSASSLRRSAWNSWGRATRQISLAMSRSNLHSRTSSPSRVERFGCRATESFESLHIRIRSKFCQNSGKLFRILQKFWNFEEISTFSRIFREIPGKFHQNHCKIQWKLSKNKDFCRNSSKNAKKVWRIFAKILSLERCEGVQIL